MMLEHLFARLAHAHYPAQGGRDQRPKAAAGSPKLMACRQKIANTAKKHY